MLLRSEYTVTRPHHAMSATRMPMPFQVALEEGIDAVLTEHDDRSWHLSVTERVDPDRLILVPDAGWYREVEGVRVPIPHLDVSTDDAAKRLLVQQLLDALAFLFDFSLNLSVRPHDDRLLPETDDDVDLLKAYATDRPLARTTVSILEPGGGGVVTAAAVEALLLQHAGTRIYADAGKTQLVTAQFRELWKVLESAFGLTDARLLEKLAAYEPISGMHAEGDLRFWLVLRGRASHAQSKAGIKELTEVEGLCQAQIDSLKPLVERVIATKEHWGYPTTGWLERLPADLRSPRGGREIPVANDEE